MNTEEYSGESLSQKPCYLYYHTNGKISGLHKDLAHKLSNS